MIHVSTDSLADLQSHSIIILSAWINTTKDSNMQHRPILQKRKILPIWHTLTRNRLPGGVQWGHVTRRKSSNLQTRRRCVFHIWLECAGKRELAGGSDAADVCCRASSPGTDAGGSFNLTVSFQKDLISAAFSDVCQPALGRSVLTLCPYWPDSFEYQMECKFGLTNIYDKQ